MFLLFQLSLTCYVVIFVFVFQAEDGIRYLVRSRGLGDVYKRQFLHRGLCRLGIGDSDPALADFTQSLAIQPENSKACLLYTSDAADERSSVDLGGRRIIKKKKITQTSST